MEVEKLISFVANHSGSLDTYAFLRRKFTKSQVAILMYHRVCPKSEDWLLEPVNPHSFERDVEYFCHNYEILSLDKLAQYIRSGKSLPKKAVVFTIDDGYKDNYIYAYPIIRKYHIPATIFLSTGYIGGSELFWLDKVRYIIRHTSTGQLNLEEMGNYLLQSESGRLHAGSVIGERLKKLPDEKRNLVIDNLLSISGVAIPMALGKEFILSWDDVREMADNGVDFGAHSVSHPILTNLPMGQAKWEISQSRKDIGQKLGKEVTAFSYPNGDFNAEIVRFIKESGFNCAVSVLQHKLISPDDSPYELSRVAMGEDFNAVKVMLSGLWGDLQHLQRNLKRAGN